jgi:hypothetical protein
MTAKARSPECTMVCPSALPAVDLMRLLPPPLACAPESTGTAWQPDTSEHQGLMSMSGDWTVSAAILQSTSCRMRWHPRMAVITRPERLGSCV